MAGSGGSARTLAPPVPVIRSKTWSKDRVPPHIKEQTMRGYATAPRRMSQENRRAGIGHHAGFLNSS